MANGEQTYRDMVRYIKRALISDFNPDWEKLCEGTYKGFIRDMTDDLEASLQVRYYETDEETELPESERELEFYYIVADEQIEVLSKRILLSDMLAEAYESHEDELLPALALSIKRFYAKIAKEV